MQICVLGSGSSGNCTAVRLGNRAVLIDAGFGPRAVAKRLQGTGIGLQDVAAILLTHLDRDHFNLLWLTAALKLNITIHLHKRHLYHLYQLDGDGARALHQVGQLVEFADQPFGLLLGGESHGTVRTFLGSHDSSGVVAYRVETPTGTLAHATDLGRASAPFAQWLADCDILAMESNYDTAMQLASSRPMDLKKRIMGGRGHLSNTEAYHAVKKAVSLSRRPPKHIVLLHLSRQCNTPQLARDVFSQDPVIAERLSISGQFDPTPWFCAGRHAEPLAGEQLAMFG